MGFIFYTSSRHLENISTSTLLLVKIPPSFGKGMVPGGWINIPQELKYRLLI